MALSATASTIRVDTIASYEHSRSAWPAFSETLVRFRPDLSLLAELDEIEGDGDLLPMRTLPRESLTGRMVGKAVLNGIFADIYAAAWAGHLPRTLVSCGSIAAWHPGHRSERTGEGRTAASCSACIAASLSHEHCRCILSLAPRPLG